MCCWSATLVVEDVLASASASDFRHHSCSRSPNFLSQCLQGPWRHSTYTKTATSHSIFDIEVEKLGHQLPSV
ncbi:hypothetical protein LY76DRAFT_231353 [Colletotrichum caudatum]|nr:hypothetical protein LY76DRAFT_231353 [Colletotrichum caudatum]